MSIYYSFIFYISIILLMAFLVPSLGLYKQKLRDINAKQRYIIIAFIAFTILVADVPMNLSPSHNGTQQTQREQYEKQAEAFAEGHLYLNYEVDEKLEDLENPYDRDARTESGAVFQYDTAFYNHHYYMYFGVTPVVLLYLPYLLITGTSLVAYKGTQVIVAVVIIGIFLLFKKLSDLFFENMNLGTYIILSVAASAITVWYVVGSPALYTVPGIFGIGLEIYSLFFLLKAVYEEHSENRSIVYAFIGGLLGALTFGCRPTIALANIIAIPLLVQYFKRRGVTLKLLGKVLIVFIPYVVVGALLMVYNYLRFENPFEFGQSYQLTTEDQSQYMSMLSRVNIKEWIHGLVHYFVISSRQLTPLELGAFVTFPVLLFIVIGVFNKKILKEMNADGVLVLGALMIIAPIITASLDILWSPYFWPRYRMDIYWVLCILAFIVIGYLLKEYHSNSKLIFAVSVLSVISIAMTFVMCIYPFDHNFTFDLEMNSVDVLKNLLTFGVM